MGKKKTPKQDYDEWLDWATRTVANEVIKTGFTGLRETLMWVTSVYAQMMKKHAKTEKGG